MILVSNFNERMYKDMKNYKKILSVALLVLVAFVMFSADAAYSETNRKKGSVYFFNFKPEVNEAWQEVAKLYTEKTGVEVKVVTKSNAYYLDELRALIDSPNPPTLFQVTPNTLNDLDEYCFNLANTDFYKELNNEAYALRDSYNRVCGVAYAVETYGIIVNRDLLEKAGYDVNDITSLYELQNIAEDITSRRQQLGFSAFCSSGMDRSSDWRFKTHLANMPIHYEYQDKKASILKKIDGEYLDNFRKLWNLYINNSTVSPDELFVTTVDEAREEFIKGKAVFYQNGSWEYANLVNSGVNKYSLAMIPLYFGVGDESLQGLCTGTENYWSVNKKASVRDIKATLDFITWCVTSEEGTKAMAQKLGFSIPFRNAAYSENVFIQQNAIYTAMGKTPISWDFTTIPSDTWKTQLGMALTNYAANQTDANWEKVVSAFVNNWEKEYRNK